MATEQIKPASKPKRPAKKRYRACRGVNLLTADGEVRFEAGDEITCSIPGKAVASWLPRGIIEEVG